MSELRAPDPTLTALDPELWVALEVRSVIGTVRVAHVLGGPYEGEDDVLSAACGALPYAHDDPRNAAYIAVPCRECFPVTPIPGVRRDASGRESGDPNLAWQVSS